MCAFERSEKGINFIMEEKLKLVQKWNKTFPKSDKVVHRKITFYNRYGITLVADLYKPKGYSDKQNSEEYRHNFRESFSRQRTEDYNNMIKNNKYSDNKELMIIPVTAHNDLYDKLYIISSDKIEEFF